MSYWDKKGDDSIDALSTLKEVAEYCEVRIIMRST